MMIAVITMVATLSLYQPKATAVAGNFAMHKLPYSGFQVTNIIFVIPSDKQSAQLSSCSGFKRGDPPPDCGLSQVCHIFAALLKFGLLCDSGGGGRCEIIVTHVIVIVILIVTVSVIVTLSSSPTL